MLFGGGYRFDAPISLVTPEGIKPFPSTGARKHDLRTLFFYGCTGITPGHGHAPDRHRQPVSGRLHGLHQTFLDGASSYTVTLPSGISEVGSGRSPCTKINRVQIDLGQDDHDHFIDPEERLRVAISRQ